MEAFEFLWKTSSLQICQPLQNEGVDQFMVVNEGVDLVMVVVNDHQDQE